jgi:endonuclease/exonuclease/phosphatase family metal-dependent hydrolase
MTPSLVRAALPTARIRLRLVLVAILASVAMFASASAAVAQDEAQGDVRVMTQNMFQGTNFTEILAAPSPDAFVGAVTATFQSVQATRPAERAAAIAREIAVSRPDLVALQEAAILRTGSGTAPATNVVSDQLELLLRELANLGQPYDTVAVVPNVDAEAPTTLGFNVRLTARTVIIARAGDPSADLDLSNVQVQEFLINEASATAVGSSIVNTRGWASVDVKIGGRKFRFVTTHLEATAAMARQAQAVELIQSAGNTTLPIVFVGDFNVFADAEPDPSFATYQLLIKSGLVDAWQQNAPGPGFTCCQDPNLLNPNSKLDHRVDLVLLRGKVGIREVQLIGDDAAARTPSGLWPSDHAGVVATLSIPK